MNVKGGWCFMDNYNKFYIDLETIMKSKNMSKNKLCNLTSLKFNALQRYYKNELKWVDLDILSRICAALCCKIEDIIRQSDFDESDDIN